MEIVDEYKVVLINGIDDIFLRSLISIFKKGNILLGNSPIVSDLDAADWKALVNKGAAAGGQITLDFLVWSGQTRKIKTRSQVMQITNISEAKAQLSARIEKVIIGKAGKPVAKIVPYDRSAEPRTPGALRGKIKIAEDFDELPDDVGAAFGVNAP